MDKTLRTMFVGVFIGAGLGASASGLLLLKDTEKRPAVNQEGLRFRGDIESITVMGDGSTRANIRVPRGFFNNLDFSNRQLDPLIHDSVVYFNLNIGQASSFQVRYPLSVGDEVRISLSDGFERTRDSTILNNHGDRSRVPLYRVNPLNSEIRLQSYTKRK